MLAYFVELSKMHWDDRYILQNFPNEPFSPLLHCKQRLRFILTKTSRSEFSIEP